MKAQVTSSTEHQAACVNRIFYSGWVQFTHILPLLVQATESQGKLSMDVFNRSFSQKGSCLGTKNKEFLVLLVTLLLTPWKHEGRSCLSQTGKKIKTNARPGLGEKKRLRGRVS